MTGGAGLKNRVPVVVTAWVDCPGDRMQGRELDRLGVVPCGRVPLGAVMVSLFFTSDTGRISSGGFTFLNVRENHF